MSTLTGKVAVVTGASKSIGASIATKLGGRWRLRRRQLRPQHQILQACLDRLKSDLA